ncbi:MAG: prolipoprotein diacylglyceryl transferase [Calditrichaeota bacterium]|nr:MAG: prolipoprotein diacylglyceryl transferase [Calditrichota bacterium]
MHPELVRIGPVIVSSYGLMLALSFIIGISLSTRLAAKRGVSKDDVINLAFVIMLSAIVGARLMYVVFHLDEFRGRWEYTFLPIQRDGSIGLSGLVLLGGVIGALLAGLVYIKYKKLPFWKISDSIAPSLALGIFLGRIGCFLNGCCFGKACDLPWGVQFPPTSPAGAIMGPVHLHPTQLYSSFYGLIIFGVLMWLERRQPQPGTLSAVFLVLYGVARFTVDFFRFYESQMFVFPGLDVNQLISLVMLGTGAMLLWKKRLLPRASEPETPSLDA